MKKYLFEHDDKALGELEFRKLGQEKHVLY